MTSTGRGRAGECDAKRGSGGQRGYYAAAAAFVLSLGVAWDEQAFNCVPTLADQGCSGTEMSFGSNRLANAHQSLRELVTPYMSPG